MLRVAFHQAHVLHLKVKKEAELLNMPQGRFIEKVLEQYFVQKEKHVTEITRSAISKELDHSNDSKASL